MPASFDGAPGFEHGGGVRIGAATLRRPPKASAAIWYGPGSAPHQLDQYRKVCSLHFSLTFVEQVPPLLARVGLPVTPGRRLPRASSTSALTSGETHEKLFGNVTRIVTSRPRVGSKAPTETLRATSLCRQATSAPVGAGAVLDGEHAATRTMAATPTAPAGPHLPCRRELRLVRGGRALERPASAVLLLNQHLDEHYAAECPQRWI